MNTAHFAADLVPATPLASAVSGAPGSTRIKIVTFNVHADNQTFEAVRDYVRAEAPDILLLLELSPSLASRLRPEELGLTVAAARPRSDYFGIGLYSRTAPETAGVVSYAGDTIPAVKARYAFGAHTLDVVGIHAVPPVSSESLRRRDALTLAAAADAASAKGLAVLVGDLNMTPWTPVFEDVLAKGLIDTRRGFGLLPTWPSAASVLGIPIDHALVTPGLRVVRRAVGPDLGSDHRPVSLTLEIPSVPSL